MAEHKVTLKTPSGEHSFSCDEDISILDQAEDEGIDLPYSCRNGSCSSCAGKCVDGTIEQEDQMFLDDAQVEEGYILTCVAKPKSDCTIETDKEGDL